MESKVCDSDPFKPVNTFQKSQSGTLLILDRYVGRSAFDSLLTRPIASKPSPQAIRAAIVVRNIQICGEGALRRRVFERDSVRSEDE